MKKDLIPMPSEYAIQHYNEEDSTNLFYKDMFEQFGQSDDEEMFWDYYWSSVSSKDNDVALEVYKMNLENLIQDYQEKDEWEEYYHKMIESDIDNDKPQLDKNKDITIKFDDIFKTQAKYRNVFPNDVGYEKKHIDTDEFSDKEKIILHRMYSEQVRASKRQTNLDKYKNTIYIQNPQNCTKEIAQYLMDNYGMFYDPNKGRLFVNNFMGSYEEFTINSKHNWLEQLNACLYSTKTMKDGNEMIISDITTTRKTLETSLPNFVDRIKEPLYTKIGFKNNVLDTETYEISPAGTNPIYTKLTVPYDYNPNARGGELERWLHYELDNPDSEIDSVQGLLEFLGFTLIEPGHVKHQWMLFIFGIGGAGKSMLLRFISHALGEDNTCTISLPKILHDNRFEYSNIINKTLVKIEEVDGNKVQNLSWFKEHTGGNPVSVEEKGRPQVTIPSKDVAKLIAIGNRPMEIDKMEQSFIRRILLLEFLRKPTQKMLNDVDFEQRVLNDDECMEWLLYQSVQAYKNMMDEHRKCVLERNDDELMSTLAKHAHSEKMIIDKYFTCIDSMEEDIKLTKNLFNGLTKILAIENGVDIRNDRSKIWKELIYELTGNKLNFKRNRRSINGSTYAYWYDVAPTPEVYEKYLRKCPVCKEYTLKDKPCIYCGSEPDENVQN